MWSFDGRRIPKVFIPKADTLSLEVFKSGYRSRHRILFFRCSSDWSKTIRYTSNLGHLVNRQPDLWSRNSRLYSRDSRHDTRKFEKLSSGTVSGCQAEETRSIRNEWLWARSWLVAKVARDFLANRNPVKLNHINWETTLVGRRCFLVEPETQWDRRCQH